MLSAQCGCLLSCLVITLLQHRTQATATTSSTTTATTSTHEHQQNHPQKQQKTVDNQTAESEADTESEFVCSLCSVIFHVKVQQINLADGSD